MSTTPAPLYPNYYEPYYQQAGTGNVGYSATTNPTQAAANNKSVIESQGNQLQLSDEELAQQQQQQQAGTQAFLNPIEQTNASGGGGYTPDQASQIELSPGQEQNIVSNAGIAAGSGTASAVGGAERAAAAAGGSPAALATYRARAAQSEAANTGNAATGAQVAAQQAGSAGAQAVGGAQIAQENQGTGYLSNLQAEQGQAQQNEQGLGQGAYSTETSGTTAGTGQQIQASQLPTTTDKIIGGVTGAATALADGNPGYLDEGQDAVVGENGMEAVIENAPKAVMYGASDPVRSNTRYMDLGGYAGDGSEPGEMGDTSGTSGFGIDPIPAAAITPNAAPNPNVQKQNWLQQYLQSNKNKPATAAPATQWNKTTPYQQAGAAIGKGLSMLSDGDQGVSMQANGRMGSGFHWSDRSPSAPATPHQLERAGYQPLAYKPKPMLADGAIAPAVTDDPVAQGNGMQVGNAKVFDKPTMVHLDKGDSVVPLSFRPKAKVRPSAALPALKARRMYGAQHAA